MTDYRIEVTAIEYLPWPEWKARYAEFIPPPTTLGWSTFDPDYLGDDAPCATRTNHEPRKAKDSSSYSTTAIRTGHRGRRTARTTTFAKRHK